MQSLSYSKDAYPTDKEISDLNLNRDCLSDHLRIFMEILVKDPLHQVSLGQALAHSMRPRSTIPPILLGLSAELNHGFGSNWVLNELDWLGLSMSYPEITWFKHSLLVNDDSKKILKEVAMGAFSLWSVDNFDQNLVQELLVHLGSLYGMGMVRSTTGATLLCRSPVKRKKVLKSSEIVKNRQVTITPYFSSEVTALSQISFMVLIQLNQSPIHSKDVSLDLFWHTARFFSSP